MNKNLFTKNISESIQAIIITRRAEEFNVLTEDQFCNMLENENKNTSDIINKYLNMRGRREKRSGMTYFNNFPINFLAKDYEVVEGFNITNDVIMDAPVLDFKRNLHSDDCNYFYIKNGEVIKIIKNESSPRFLYINTGESFLLD